MGFGDRSTSSPRPAPTWCCQAGRAARRKQRCAGHYKVRRPRRAAPGAAAPNSAPGPQQAAWRAGTWGRCGRGPPRAGLGGVDRSIHLSLQIPRRKMRAPLSLSPRMCACVECRYGLCSGLGGSNCVSGQHLTPRPRDKWDDRPQDRSDEWTPAAGGPCVSTIVAP